MAKKTYVAVGRCDTTEGRMPPGKSFSVEEGEGKILVNLGMAKEEPQGNLDHARGGGIEIPDGMNVLSVLDLLVKQGHLTPSDRELLNKVFQLLAEAPHSALSALMMLEDAALLMDGEFTLLSEALAEVASRKAGQSSGGPAPDSGAPPLPPAPPPDSGAPPSPPAPPPDKSTPPPPPGPEQSGKKKPQPK